jgi:uncharacterized protein YjbJ (UPF0337 family)
MGDIWLRTLVKMGLDPKDADAKLEIFRTKLNEHFGSQQGGGGESLLNTVGASFIDFVSTSKGVAVFLSTLPKFVFILKTVEKIPAIGILVGVVLDAMLTALSTGGEMFQNLVVLVPGAGPAIVAIFGIFFWPPVAMIAFSRADFSEATEIYLKAIPFGIGKILSTAFAKTDKFATKIADRLGLIKVQVTSLVDKLKGAVSNAKSIVQEKTQGVVEGIKDKATAIGTNAFNTLGKKTEEVTDRLVGKLTDKLSNAKDALKGKATGFMDGLRDKAESMGSNALDGAKDALKGKATGLMDGLRDKAESMGSNALGSKVDELKDLGNSQLSKMPDVMKSFPSSRKSFGPMLARKRGGSKRLSNKKRTSNKLWRKTKRTKSARR